MQKSLHGQVSMTEKVNTNFKYFHLSFTKVGVSDMLHSSNLITLCSCGHDTNLRFSKVKQNLSAKGHTLLLPMFRRKK